MESEIVNTLFGPSLAVIGLFAGLGLVATMIMFGLDLADRGAPGIVEEKTEKLPVSTHTHTDQVFKEAA